MLEYFMQSMFNAILYVARAPARPADGPRSYGTIPELYPAQSVRALMGTTADLLADAERRRPASRPR